MPRIVRRPLAERDLDEIWLHIAQDSPGNADKFLDEIERVCIKLARFSNIGRNRDDLHFGIQSFPVGKYLIFYTAHENGIDIIRVLHGMMDIEAIFLA